MSYFKFQGSLPTLPVASNPGFVQLTNASPGPTTILTAGADEWIDLYSIIITTNDTTLQTVTLDDGVGGTPSGTNTINVYYCGGAGVAGGQLYIADFSSVPFRTRKKGAIIRATAGAVTSGKTINIKLGALVSKT